MSQSEPTRQRMSIICADCNQVIGSYYIGDDAGRAAVDRINHECKQQRAANRRAQAQQRKAASRVSE